MHYYLIYILLNRMLQILDILQILKIGKACGDDGITHQMLKSTSETICIPLTRPIRVFNTIPTFTISFHIVHSTV
jgi:hypothetical protein